LRGGTDEKEHDMPINQNQDIDQSEINVAQELIDAVIGDAEEYSKDPEAWLDSHPQYANVSPQAVEACGAGGFGGGTAVAHASAGAATSGVAGITAQLNPIVYNHYYEVDNSVTNNLEADGNINVVTGDGNVVAGDDLSNTGQIQTGDGIQVGGDVEGSNLNTGDNVQQAIDESTNIGGDVGQGANVTSGGGGIADGSTDTNVDASIGAGDESQTQVGTTDSTQIDDVDAV
jgi:hypothetical protein